jgi:tetratricopeptide (TPR) repeat protein
MLEQQKAGVPYQALLGRAQESLREGNVDQGMADLDRAADDLRKIAADSNKYEDQMRLAGILMAQGQIAEEHKRADDAKRTFDEAETTLRRAIELAPQQPAIRLKWVQLLHRRNKTREAEQAIADARKALPPDKAHLALAQCYELIGRLAEAEQQYEAAMETTPDGEGVARSAADFYLRGKQTAKGEAIVKSIVQGERKVSPDDLAWARRRLALLLLERGDPEGRRNAIAMLDDNLKTDPQSLVDQRLKARALALKGTRKDRQEARAMLESLVGIPQPLPQDRFELAKIVMVDEGWNSASRQMQPLLAMNDVEPTWLQFYVRAQIENNELEGAEANLKRLEQLLPNHFSAAFFHAQILSQRGKHDAAMAAMADFLKLPKAEPNDRTVRLSVAAQALEGLAKSLPAAERDKAAKKYLQQAEAYYRDFVTLRPDQEIVLVGFLGRRGRREEALKLAETAAEKAQPAALATTLVDLVTKGTPTPEEIQRAEKILAGATEKHGRSVPLLLATADLRIVQQRYDDAEKLYRDAIRDEENNFVAMNDLACFLSLRKSKLDEALKLVDKAIQLAGPLAALYDTRATVYLAMGQPKESLADMETALGDEPNGTRYFHQAQALFLDGQKEAASAAMKEADKAGLTVDELRPIERPAYRQLQQDLQ